ncbi:hypothetical protein [Microvirga splendida]|uniref:Anti-sigma factor n=1 Tax=Microvirga splendida TaxID=2795727 RepID=A0ABS0XVT5_9HYPH|nr:hypothetical protein [Microvirga splendida]MBJ6123845.1 hypothetical protein [Microvirga splendida]
MSELHLTDEVLMAFADGELDEPVAAAVAGAMAQNPTVARKIVEFQQSRRLTRSVFASNLAPDVPSELRAAVAAQIEAYEAVSRAGERQEPVQTQSIRSEWRSRAYPMKMALAASVAAVAVAAGYFIGQQSQPEAGRLAQLEDPLVRQELGRLGSGSEVELPFGRLRVISTYRLADQSLCREFRLHSGSSATDAVACRADEWDVTFAAAAPVSDAEYTPSSGGDLVDSYLGNLGAGPPLAGEAEAEALAQSAR